MRIAYYQLLCVVCLKLDCFLTYSDTVLIFYLFLSFLLFTYKKQAHTLKTIVNAMIDHTVCDVIVITQKNLSSGEIFVQRLLPVPAY